MKDPMFDHTTSHPDQRSILEAAARASAEINKLPCELRPLAVRVVVDLYPELERAGGAA